MVNIRVDFQLQQQNPAWVSDQNDFFTPLIVNAAFSLELHLKYLILNDNLQLHGHELYKLFQALRPETRTKLEERFNDISSRHQNQLAPIIQSLYTLENIRIEWRIDLLLELSSKAFSEWRYVYESTEKTHAGKTTSFIGYSHIIYAIRSLISDSKKS
jgi:hypothetical protein